MVFRSCSHFRSNFLRNSLLFLVSVPSPQMSESFPSASEQGRFLNKISRAIEIGVGVKNQSTIDKMTLSALLQEESLKKYRAATKQCRVGCDSN